MGVSEVTCQSKMSAHPDYSQGMFPRFVLISRNDVTSDSVRDGHHSQVFTQRHNTPVSCANENSKPWPYSNLSNACGYKMKYITNTLSMMHRFIAL